MRFIILTIVVLGAGMVIVDLSNPSTDNKSNQDNKKSEKIEIIKKKTEVLPINNQKEDVTPRNKNSQGSTDNSQVQVSGSNKQVTPKLNIQNGDIISNNFILRGVMTDGWYDQGGIVGTLKLYDDSNILISEATLKSDNPSGLPENDHKNFIATIYFQKQPTTTTGKLVLKNNNPSGQPEKDKISAYSVKF